jgi:hypothetical protein
MLRMTSVVFVMNYSTDVLWGGGGGWGEELYRHQTQNVVFTSVAEPEPDPEGSETFGRIRIRSGTDINVLDPDSNPDPNLDPNQ